MKKILFIATGVVVLAAAVWYFFIKEPTFNATDGYLVNLNDKGVIIEGYDPVAYFTDNMPVKGNEQFRFKYHGATYWFASAEHANTFKSDPEKYLPQYGAFCGYAVSIGKLRPVDPTIYQIENGRLILQHTKEAYDLFNKDLKASVVKADKNWPGLESTRVGKKVEFDKPASAPTASK
ncbi:MAG TPA: YHS domain-containing (seleno)protein [Chitinophagaceae bacterium]